MLSQHSPGKGELSGMQNPACLAPSYYRPWNSVYPVRDCRQQRKGHMKEL